MITALVSPFDTAISHAVPIGISFVRNLHDGIVRAYQNSSTRSIATLTPSSLQMTHGSQETPQEKEDLVWHIPVDVVTTAFSRQQSRVVASSRYASGSWLPTN
jgi:hypothetical protein